MNAAREKSGPAPIWHPIPEQDSAANVAATLLDEKLIACANIVPTMASLFEWSGERGEEHEAGMLLETEATLLERAIAGLAALHPHDQPAIVGWRCDAASPVTAAWLAGLPE